MDVKPLKLTLEFTRSGREPFRLGEQEYLHRKEAGRFLGASLTWGESLLKDLAELGQPEPTLATVHRLGAVLRGFLDPVGWEAYEARIQEALAAKQPVFLSFQFDADELYALPWELLTLGGSGQRLAELPGLLLRYEWPETRTAPLDPDPPRGGRILYAWSSAGGLVPSEKQGQALRQACARGGVAFDPQRDVLANASASGLAAALGSPEPVAVLHLLCHGSQQGPQSLGLLLDASRPGGEPEFIDGQALAGLLAPHARTLRLVVLSACQSGATGAPGGTLPGVARALHQAGIQCVVASRLPLSVEGSVEFTETLYGELLGTPCSLEHALGLARDRLRRTPTRLDWASLQLYARAADGTDTRPLALRPYRGLLAFQPEHSRFFFGREPLKEELLNRVDESRLKQRVEESSTNQRHRFQVVAGTSGSGKSSLVLAGLVAHLDKSQWDVVVTRPGEGRGFNAPKSGNGASPESRASLLTLWTALHRQWAPRESAAVTAPDTAELLAEAARLRQASPERRLLVVVDQFEEVFTQLPSLAERQAYVGALWALAEQQDLGIIILCTLRVDYFSRCGEVAVDGKGKRLDAVVYSDEHRMFVTQLQGEQLQAVIEGPARKVGLCLDEGLVEVLLRDVGSEPGALPLLEYALDLLWEKRVGNRLTHRAYEEIGGVGGALTGAANRLLAGFSPEEARVARQLLVELVDFSDDASPHTRRRGWLAQLRPSGKAEQELFERVLARLVGSRLLVKGGDGSDASEAGSWVEVAHESLIRRWETLTEWVRADRKAAQERRELRTLVDKWKAHLTAPDKGVSFLLVGYRLEAARHLQQEHGAQLAQDLHQFIDESWRRAAARRRAARLRSVSLLTAAVVVALVMTGLMINAQRQAQKADEEHKNAEVARGKAAEKAQLAHDLARITVARRKMRADPTTSLLFLRDVEKPESAMSWGSDVRHVLDEPLNQALLEGHEDEILWVDFSPDGKRVATGSRDGTARVWESNGEEVLRHSHDNPVVQVAFSPDGKWLVASTEDGKAYVHSLAGKEQVAPKPLQEQLRAVAFSPDGTWVVTASVDHSVKLWRGLEGSEPLHVLQEKGGPTVRQLAFSPKSTHVLTVSPDRVQVWQLDGQEKPVKRSTRSLTSAALGAAITSAALSPDGTYLAVTLSGPLTRVLRMSDGKVLWAACKDKVAHKLMRAEFSPDGEQVLIASRDLVAQLRTLGQDSCEGRLFEGHKSDIQRATFSPDGHWVLTASKDGISRLWRVKGDAELLPPYLELRGHRIGVTWAAFSPDSHYVVTGSADMTARLWSLRQNLRFSTKFEHPSGIRAVATSPDREHLAAAAEDGIVRIWSPKGHKLADLKGHSGVVRASAFSPDSQWLVTGGMDETLRLWALSGVKGVHESHTVMEATHTVETAEVMHMAVAFRPGDDMRRVVTGGSDGLVYFWELETSEAPARLRKLESFPTTVRHDQTIRSVAFSSEGDWLITASEDHLAKVWDASTGELKTLLRGHTNWVRSATFSPDGQFALTASQDGSARVWDLRQKEPQGILFKHGIAVRWAAFSPDGAHFATAAVDGLVRIWALADKDTQEPKPILVLSGHEDEVTSLAYMDEDRLVTSSFDGTVRLWNNIELESTDKKLKALREELSTVTSRCLGQEEWALHIGGEFPESTQKAYEECKERRRTQKVEPTPVANTKGAE